MLFVLSACVPVPPVDKVEGLYDDVYSSANEIISRQTGMLAVLLIVEAQTNVSSLLIDKTKPKAVNFRVSDHRQLPEFATYYIMPAKVTSAGQIIYDESYSRMVKNYIFLSERGDITQNIEQADYIVFVEIDESGQALLGTNSSKATITFFNQLDIPEFYTTVTIKSSYDENFFYFPSKHARPVKYLTMQAMGKLFEHGVPKAYGETVTRYEALKKKAKEKFAQVKKDVKEINRSYKLDRVREEQLEDAEDIPQAAEILEGGS